MSHIACNQYAWQTFYRREGRSWHDAVAHGVAEIAQAGFDGFEPILSSTEQLNALIPLLQRNGLAMRSIYVNSVLHVGDAVGQSIEQALALADTAAAASQLGTQTIVTNPSPIAWNGTESKTDEQLEIQADALGRLGRALHERGLTLAYHVHDAELRHAARELHHMLTATSPEHVTFCLDPDWIWRGAGFSQVALFDVVARYGSRVSELHLRQSRGNVWAETLGEGDIAYARLVQQLGALRVRPHIVLEQAVSSDTPHTLSALEAHRHSLAYVRDLVAGL